MTLSTLTAISPLDGRYATKTQSLREVTSEYALIKQRCLIEVEWFRLLSRQSAITEIPSLNADSDEFLTSICQQFSLEDAKRVKAIEQTTNHDVKAVEYYLKERFAEHAALAPYSEFIHFACTSEDINNLAYGLMLKQARDNVLREHLQGLTTTLRDLAHQYANQPMLSRTHGQAASPTTVGKEFANFVARLECQFKAFMQLPIYGKINGAVGNFNAHHCAYPEVDWRKLSQQFVTQLGLHYQPYTTQIEPHDGIAEYFAKLCRINTIFVDFARDCWSYISVNYFKQKPVANEVGSSTMPHKINPIDFENAEGNLRLANAIMQFLGQQLSTSRWQRDLIDSTLLRNIGVGLGHSIIAYSALAKGLAKLAINEDMISRDLNHHWEVITEAIQTVMRRYGIANPYEQLKKLSRGQEINEQTLKSFINTLALPAEVTQRLLSLTPENYIGYAEQLANEI